MIGIILIIAGTGLRMTCYRLLAKHFTFELTLQKDHQLVTDGPYAFVRHPAYTGGFAVNIGCLLFNLGRGAWWTEYAVTSSFGSIWMVVAVMQTFSSALVIYGAILRCKLEDEMMKEYFKTQWESWAKKTPYRLFPFLF
jgi:protein-S-isoprenylcysteine O-methyltransferase Ste14